MKAFIGFLVCSLIATGIYYMLDLDKIDNGEKKSLFDTLISPGSNAQDQEKLFKEISKGQTNSAAANFLKTTKAAKENMAQDQRIILDEISKGEAALMENVNGAQRNLSGENQGNIVEELSNGQAALIKEVVAQEEALNTKVKKVKHKAKSDVAYKRELQAIRRKYKVSLIVIGSHSLAIINGAKTWVGDVLEGGEKVIKMSMKTVTIKSGDSEYILMK